MQEVLLDAKVLASQAMSLDGMWARLRAALFVEWYLNVDAVGGVVSGDVNLRLSSAPQQKLQVKWVCA